MCYLHIRAHHCAQCREEGLYDIITHVAPGRRDALEGDTNLDGATCLRLQEQIVSEGSGPRYYGIGADPRALVARWRECGGGGGGAEAACAEVVVHRPAHDGSGGQEHACAFHEELGEARGQGRMPDPDIVPNPPLVPHDGAGAEAQHWCAVHRAHEARLRRLDSRALASLRERWERDHLPYLREGSREFVTVSDYLWDLDGLIRRDRDRDHERDRRPSFPVQRSHSDSQVRPRRRYPHSQTQQRQDGGSSAVDDVARAGRRKRSYNEDDYLAVPGREKDRGSASSSSSSGGRGPSHCDSQAYINPHQQQQRHRNEQPVDTRASASSRTRRYKDKYLPVPSKDRSRHSSPLFSRNHSLDGSSSRSSESSGGRSHSDPGPLPRLPLPRESLEGDEPHRMPSTKSSSRGSSSARREESPKSQRARRKDEDQRRRSERRHSLRGVLDSFNRTLDRVFR